MVNHPRRASATSRRSASALPRERRCPRSCTGAGSTSSASRCSTASARPRPTTSTSRTGPGAVRIGSLGQACPGYEAIVVGEDGTEAAGGRAGELCVAARAPRSVLGRPREVEADFAGDWIRSGDLFVRDADGYFWYQGRADDLLKVGGIWVAPLEIENCLRRAPGRRRVRRRRYRGGRADPRPRASSSSRRGRPPTSSRPSSRSSGRASRRHKVPREVAFVAVAAEDGERQGRPQGARAGAEPERRGRLTRPPDGLRTSWHRHRRHVHGLRRRRRPWPGRARQGLLDAARLLDAASWPRSRSPRTSWGRARRAAAGARLFLHSHHGRGERGRRRDARDRRADHQRRVRGHAVRDARRLRPLVGAHRGREAEPDRDRQAGADRPAQPDQGHPRARRTSAGGSTSTPTRPRSRRLS